MDEYLSNILFPNNDTVFTLNFQSINLNENNLSLLMGLYPVYKHHWINASLKVIDNKVSLVFDVKLENNLNTLNPKNAIHDEQNNCIMLNDYIFDYNAYSYFRIKNYPLKFNIKSIDKLTAIGILEDACRYGYLTTTNKAFASKNNFSKITLNSLSIENQKKVLDLFLKRKNCILTGDTGVGKTSQIPKLLWWFNNLFDGYTFFEESITSNLIPYFTKEITFRNTLLSLPRIVLIQKNAKSIAKSLGYKEIDGSCINTIYKDVTPEYQNSNPSTNNLFLFIVNQLMLIHSKNANTIIIDEIHEHDTYALINIAVIYKKFKVRNLVLMSATLDDDFDRIKEYFNNIEFIHIKGSTLYPIVTEVYPELNYVTIINKIIKKGIFTNGTSIIIFQTSKNKVLKLLEYLQKEFPRMYYITAYSGDDKLDDNIKIVETNGLMNIIIGTPILESSITINNAVAVIDDCKFFMVHFRYGYNSDITKSMQTQRKGRVGRVRNGWYFCTKIITQSKYRKIDNEYLWPYLIYALKYNLRFDELFIIPKDMSRFEKSINYLYKKDILIRRDIDKYFRIFTSYNNTLIEYLKIYNKNLNKLVLERFIKFDESQSLKDSNPKEYLNQMLIGLLKELNIKVTLKKAGTFLMYKVNDEFEDPTNNFIITSAEVVLKSGYLIGNDMIIQ